MLFFLISEALLCLPKKSHPEAPRQGHRLIARRKPAKYPASKAIDGKVSDDSRWVSEKSIRALMARRRPRGNPQLAGVHLFTGYGAKDVISDFKIQFWSAGKWQDIPSAVIRQQGQRPRHRLRPNRHRRDRQLRIWITATHQDTARIKEIVVWPAGSATSRRSRNPPARPPGGHPSRKSREIYLNQSGFNLGKPKRFTAPTLADGTPSSSAPRKAATRSPREP
jgi:hypothetical protein